jgi:hypothetical protein
LLPFRVFGILWLLVNTDVNFAFPLVLYRLSKAKATETGDGEAGCEQMARFDPACTVKEQTEEERKKSAQGYNKNCSPKRS